MKIEPQYQGQHRVSQVYLKQFGYKKDDAWMLSVYEIGKKHTSNVKISDFTKEVNIFDLPFKQPELKRHFENESGKVENKYPTIISNLHNQKRLTPNDKVILDYFVANILCRTNPFRIYIDDLLRTPDTRKKFINEMTMFSKNTQYINKFLDLFKIDHQLNLAIGALMSHLVYVFSYFDKVIIKSPDEGWLTTDNPVYIDKHGHTEWIIPLEAEIYMPLSKDFCLFMFHTNSNKESNPLKKLRLDRINSIDFNTFKEISSKIASNQEKYLIFNTEIEETDLMD